VNKVQCQAKYPIFKGKFHFFEPEKNRTIAYWKAEESQLRPLMGRVGYIPVSSVQNRMEAAY